MKSHKKIMVMGDLDRPRSTAWQRFQTFKSMGHEVVGFSDSVFLKVTQMGRILQRLPGFTGNIFDKKGLDRYNLGFVDQVKLHQPEIAWIEKPLLLQPETLREARRVSPHTFFVCFQDDDPLGPLTLDRPALWINFVRCIPEFDLHFVKRDGDSVEFKAKGARETRRFIHGVCTEIFYPVDQSQIPEHQRHSVLFIGATRDRRVDTVETLLSSNLPVTVYGNGWTKTQAYRKYPERFHSFCSEEDYPVLVSGAKISLGFVAHSQRDEFNGRSFEIPGCGGFFLAERTPAHREFYEEGKEAEFFSNAEECAEKSRFYLAHESSRKKIAEAGYRRCIDSDYSMKRRLQDALNDIEQLIGK